jgi:hypothetical protein
VRSCDPHQQARREGGIRAQVREVVTAEASLSAAPIVVHNAFRSRPAMRANQTELLAVLLWAAPFVSAACSPCEDDALECGEGGEFAFSDDCELSGPLEVELGEGFQEFSSLAPLQEPALHDGIQGGHHFWLGLRVTNPALDNPLLRLVLDAEVLDENRCGAEPDCDPWIGTGHRELILGPELTLDDDGNVEQIRLMLQIAIWPLDVERRLRLYAIDPCRREATIEHPLEAM